MTSREIYEIHEFWDDVDLGNDCDSELRRLGDRAAELFRWLHSGKTWNDGPELFVCF